MHNNIHNIIIFSNKYISVYSVKYILPSRIKYYSLTREMNLILSVKVRKIEVPVDRENECGEVIFIFIFLIWEEMKVVSWERGGNDSHPPPTHQNSRIHSHCKSGKRVVGSPQRGPYINKIFIIYLLECACFRLV